MNAIKKATKAILSKTLKHDKVRDFVIGVSDNIIIKNAQSSLKRHPWLTNLVRLEGSRLMFEYNDKKFYAYLHQNQTMVTANHVIAAMAQRVAYVQPDGTIEPISDHFDIIMDDILTYAPAPMRDSLVMHEFGHFILGHLDQPSDHLDEFMPHFNRDHEHQADLFSQSLGNPMIETLEWFKVAYRHRMDTTQTKYIDWRIEMLRNAKAPQVA